jgi:SAM-dependent methyltransferase
MRDWVVPLLRCLECARSLERGPQALACPGCGTLYPIVNDLTDFLPRPNPIVVRERAAVAALDGGAANLSGRLRELLQQLDKDPGALAEADFAVFPCLRNAAVSSGQLREVLAQHPLPRGATVLELGADHCWASNLLLDAGCRVIATDITDHLRLATRSADPRLCRILADMNAVPLADDTVDVVWATAAAHHSWDLRRTFREAHRVLKPGGRLYFCCEPMASWARYFLGRDFGHEEKVLGINETWIPRSKWLRLCATSGFQPRLAFPSLDRAAIEERLARRRLPRSLVALVRPFLKALQVSIHLVATKS